MKIIYSKKFLKNFKRADSKIQSAFEKKILLFQKDKINPLLNNHALHGNLRNYRSINISGDWRAIYWHRVCGTIEFIALGTHSMLYK